MSSRRRHLNTELSNKISRTPALFSNPIHVHRRTQQHVRRARLHITIHKTKGQELMHPRFMHTELAKHGTHFFRVLVLCERVKSRTCLLWASKECYLGRFNLHCGWREIDVAESEWGWGRGNHSGLCDATIFPLLHTLCRRT